MTMVISTLDSRFSRSLFTRVSSSLRECSSSLTVFSSSLVLCSSSLLDRILLVGRLQLFVGGLELLNDRLQVLAAGGQLARQPAHALVGLAAGGRAAGGGVCPPRGRDAAAQRYAAA
jgi:hypothetical protein